jgi:hypothetical protein
MLEVWVKYLLHLRNFVAEEFPDEGTLVPKHVGVGSLYEVCFVVYNIVM